MAFRMVDESSMTKINAIVYPPFGLVESLNSEMVEWLNSQIVDSLSRQNPTQRSNHSTT